MFVVRHPWPFERAAEAYEMFDDKEDHAVKVVLTT